MTDLKKLRELAEAATPGPWRFDYGNGAIESENKEHYRITVAVIDNLSERHFHCEQFGLGWNPPYFPRHPDLDMEFIEAANPETVIALIDRIEKLELQLKEANEALSWYADEKNWMTTRKDELHEARMTIAQDPDSFGVCSEPGLASTLLLIGGKRARAYLEKFNGGKI